MAKARILVIGLFLVLSATLPAAAATQSEVRCDPIQEAEICIEEVSLSDSTVDAGSTIEISLTVRNVGDETGDTTILIGVHQPEGGYDYLRADEIHNIEPGKSQSVSLPILLQKGEPVGVHEVNIMLFDSSQQHLYDATGYYQKVVVEEDSFNLLQWLQGLHYSVQILIGLGTLAVLIFGKILTG
jgi:hypothetical protein